VDVLDTQGRLAFDEAGGVAGDLPKTFVRNGTKGFGCRCIV
jgi:hypothetical protein